MTSLSASPELWPTIVQALERSRYFVLLASPESARSARVEQEIAWWRANRASVTLLIVLTGGELRRDHETGDSPDGFGGAAKRPRLACVRAPVGGPALGAR